MKESSLVHEQIALMLTRRCNMACAHCSVESGPRLKGEPTEEVLLERVREGAAAGVKSFLFTGGEPMLREAVLLSPAGMPQARHDIGNCDEWILG